MKAQIRLSVLFYLFVVSMLILFGTCVKAKAHDLHFEGFLAHNNHTVVAQGWIDEIGYCFATDTDNDGLPDEFWLLYKDGDLTHHQGMQLHVRPLTKETAKRLLRR